MNKVERDRFVEETQKLRCRVRVLENAIERFINAEWMPRDRAELIEERQAFLDNMARLIGFLDVDDLCEETREQE